MRILFTLIFFFFIKTSFSQQLSCVDSADLKRTAEYIKDHSINGFIYQLNLINTDVTIKNNLAYLQEAHKSIIQNYFTDSAAYFYNSLLKSSEKDFRTISDFLMDLYAFHKAHEVRFGLTDINCEPNLYSGVMNKKAFMYMVLTAVLTTEVYDKNMELNDVKFDTLIFFYRIKAYDDPASKYFGTINAENIVVWQVLNNSLVVDLGDKIPYCDDLEEPYFILDRPQGDLNRIEYGSISFNTEPAGATLKFEGIPICENWVTPFSADTFFVSKFKVNVSKKGYYSKDTIINVLPNKKNKFRMRLIGQNGTLFVSGLLDSDYVLIDGGIKDSRNLPFSLSVGPHKIIVRRPFHEDFSLQFVIEPGTARHINVELTPKKGTLVLQSKDFSAVGGTFSISGTKYSNMLIRKEEISKGIQIPVDQGYIIVEVVKSPWENTCYRYSEGYFTYRDTILIDSNQPYNLNIKLKPYHTVYVSIKPTVDGAEIYVDGIKMPCPLPAYIPMAAEPIEFKLIANGKTFEKTFIIESKRKNLKWNLNKF